MHISKLQTIFPLIATLLFASAAAAASQTVIPQDSIKKRIERQKTFLLRSSDELNSSLTSLNETVEVLIEQVEAAAGCEDDRKRDERLALLDWYQRYSEWLKGMANELDQDVSSFFAKHSINPRWILRYEELTKGSSKLGEELGGTVQKLEGEKRKIEARMKKVNTAVVERRVLVDKDDLELARELWPAYRVSYDRREAVYKELSDAEVLYLRDELRSLDEQQKYFECLSELAAYEIGWLNIKAEDYEKLSEISKVIDDVDPAAVAYVYKDAIRNYETQIAALKRRSSELGSKIHGITRTGSLKTLDLLDEQSRYYEKMKSRYDRHIDWLKSQINSYQADLVEIGKEL